MRCPIMIEARDAFGGVLQVPTRFLDRDVERHRVRRRAFNGVDAVLEHAARVVRKAATDGDNGHAVTARGSGARTAGVLPKCGLEVDAAFAGKRERGALHVLVELRRLDDELHATLHDGVGEGEQSAHRDPHRRQRRKPVRRRLLRSRRMSFAKCARLRSSICTISGVAPFCGP